jgi:hypothetical protein
VRVSVTNRCRAWRKDGRKGSAGRGYVWLSQFYALLYSRFVLVRSLVAFCYRELYVCLAACLQSKHIIVFVIIGAKLDRYEFMTNSVFIDFCLAVQNKRRSFCVSFSV